MLYQIVNNDEVLIKVIGLVASAQKQLIVVQGEDDLSPVQPDENYFGALRAFSEKGGQIIRCYFGNRENFLQEKKNNPGIEYVYCGKMKNYQRAVICDGRYAMAKIGGTFVFSTNRLWVNMLTAYLEECSRKNFMFCRQK